MQPNSKARSPPACQTFTSDRTRLGAIQVPVQMQFRVAPWIGRPLPSWPGRSRDHDVPKHSRGDSHWHRRRGFRRPGRFRLASPRDADGTGLRDDDGGGDGLGSWLGAGAEHRRVTHQAAVHRSATPRYSHRNAGPDGFRLPLHGFLPLAEGLSIRPDLCPGTSPAALGLDRSLAQSLLDQARNREYRWLLDRDPVVRPGILGDVRVLLRPGGTLDTLADPGGVSFHWSVPCPGCGDALRGALAVGGRDHRPPAALPLNPRRSGLDDLRGDRTHLLARTVPIPSAGPTPCRLGDGRQADGRRGPRD